MSAENTKVICWRADSPEKRLQGEMKYGPTSGAELDLFDHFYQSFNDEKLVERFTLHGLNLKARPFTLFNCMISGMEINLPGGRSCGVVSVFGVVGGHYESPDKIMFKKVQVQFTGLVAWTCTTVIGVQVEENPQSLTVT